MQNDVLGGLPLSLLNSSNAYCKAERANVGGGGGGFDLLMWKFRQSKCGKIRIRIIPNTDTSYAV